MEHVKTADKFAIFQTGGKQYQAIEGKTLAIEKIEGDAGAQLEFSEVYFRKLANGTYEVGKPHLKATVKATIIKQMRGPKIDVFRFKRRKKVRVKHGHRQPITVIRVESV